MTKAKKLGIWMDHASAHVMEFNDRIITNIVLSDATHAQMLHMQKKRKPCKKEKA